MHSFTLTPLILLLLYLQINLCFLWHFQFLQGYPLLWVSWFNLENLDLQEIFKIFSFYHIFSIVLQYFSHIWINSYHVFLSSVWNTFLKGYWQMPEPTCVLWSYYYPDWQGSHYRPLHLHIFQHFNWTFSNISPSLVKPWYCFTDLSTMHFTVKQEQWNFILVSILKSCWLVSMLKSITHWVSP